MRQSFKSCTHRWGLKRYAASLAAMLAIVATNSSLAAIAADDATPAGQKIQSGPDDEGRVNGEPAAEQVVRGGVVVDEQGNPAAGISVTGYGGEERFDSTATTNAQGRFTLLSVRFFGPMFIVAKEPQGRQGVFHWALDDAFGKGAIRITLKPPRKVNVLVVDAKGAPVEGAQAAVQVRSRMLTSGLTDTSGRWSAEIPADAYVGHVFAFKAGVGFDYFSTAEKRGDYVRKLPPENVTLTLSGARTVRITAVDTGGNPVPGLRIMPLNLQLPGQADEVSLASDWDPTVSLTDAAGMAVFDWLPQVVTKSIHFLPYPSQYQAPDPANVEPKGNGTTETTLLVKRKSRLTGLVRLADGRPAKNFKIRANGVGASWSNEETVQSKMDGSFEMTLASDLTYVVALEDDRWAAPSHVGVIVREGHEVADLDFTLHKGTIIRGQLTVGENLAPAAHKYVSLWMNSGFVPPIGPNAGRPIYRSQINRSGITDADGKYRFCVSSGTYQLTPFLPAAVFSRVEVTVRDEREIVHDFHLPRPPGKRLEGQVVDAEMQPFAGAHLTGAPKASQLEFRNVTAKHDGKFEFEDALIPLVIHAQTTDGLLAGVARIETDDQPRKIRLGPTASARGRLLDANGQAIAGVNVHHRICYDGQQIDMDAIKLDRYYTAPGITDTNGRFELRGLVPGEQYVLEYEPQPDSYRWLPLTTIRALNTKVLELGDLRTKIAD